MILIIDVVVNNHLVMLNVVNYLLIN